ncbi:MAG: hypothetical protein LQ351_006406 [Letrouitia transgressa]|nr:MAG: hypothetical protein LQ351_006406 [Letrouitia transgressa]
MPRNAHPKHGADGSSLVSHADIFMSIKPEHMANIASGAKIHEYRKYLLPPSVRYIWFYTTAPVSAIQYVARVSRGKVLREVPEDGGLGNADFNAGKKESKFGYRILALWELGQPVTLHQAIEKGYLKGPPQKYTFVPKRVLQEYELEKQTKVIARDEAVEDDIQDEDGKTESAKREGERESQKSSEEKHMSNFFEKGQNKSISN